MADKFYIDYRIGKIVKNLDTSFLAPEQYNEIIVDNVRAGTYTYRYTDRNDHYLDFSFTTLALQAGVFTFEELLAQHCGRHNFVPREIVWKRLYISQKDFDAHYQEDPRDFEVEWGNYRNMCRMSHIANITKEQFKEHFDAGKSGKKVFIELHEVRVKRMISNLASRIGCSVTLEEL